MSSYHADAVSGFVRWWCTNNRACLSRGDSGGVWFSVRDWGDCGLSGAIGGSGGFGWGVWIGVWIGVDGALLGIEDFDLGINIVLGGLGSGEIWVG